VTPGVRVPLCVAVLLASFVAPRPVAALDGRGPELAAAETGGDDAAAEPEDADGAGTPGAAETGAAAPGTGSGNAATETAVRGARLQGMAFFARNRQVVGATVTVHEMERRSRLFLTASDDKGSFLIDGLPNGNYSVQVEREGLAPVVKTDVQVRFPFRAIVEVAMEPLAAAPGSAAPAPGAGGNGAASGASVHGVARAREGGAPVGEVEVRLVHGRAGQDPRQVATGADGSFEIADLAPGPWRLEARGAGFLPLRTTLALDGDAELVVSLVRQPAGHEPSPLDLMPDEQPIPPAGLPGRLSPPDLRAGPGADLQRTAK